MRGAVRQIIVIDDDAGVRQSLEFLLETAGYAVECFGSAPHYLAVLQPATVICLIVDQRMPEMTGLEFLADLRRRGIHLPAILITGSPSPDVMQRAAALDVRDVLPKPLVADGLLRFVAAAAR